jgi:peptide deformylase
MSELVTVAENRSLLNTRSTPVDLSKTEYVDELVSDLLKHLPKRALGLAASQIGRLDRAFAANLKDGLYVVLNPNITTSGESIESNEGCLSVPEHVFRLRRSTEVLLTADRVIRCDADGSRTDVPLPLSVSADDARIIQHEFDHIEGVLVCDKGIAIETPDTRKAAMKAQIRAEKVAAERHRRREAKRNKYVSSVKAKKPQTLTKQEAKKAKRKEQKSRKRARHRMEIAMRYAMTQQGINLTMTEEKVPDQIAENSGQHTKETEA